MLRLNERARPFAAWLADEFLSVWRPLIDEQIDLVQQVLAGTLPQPPAFVTCLVDPLPLLAAARRFDPAGLAPVYDVLIGYLKVWNNFRLAVLDPDGGTMSPEDLALYTQMLALARYAFESFQTLYVLGRRGRPNASYL